MMKTLARLPSDSVVTKDDDLLKRAIIYSVAGHALAVAAFIVRMVVYPNEPLTLDNAIRVDIVALPDKSPKLSTVPTVETKIPPPSPPLPEPIQEKSEPEPAKPPPVKIQPAPKVDTNKVDLNKAHKTEEAALKRLAALEKIEHMTKSQSRAAPAPQPIKGNEISHGGALSGVTRLEQQGYLQTIDGAVKAHWNLPGFLSNANLSARARLFIDAQGAVLKRTITQSSHNDIYDSRVLAAIDAASPLPPPPKTLVNILEVDGIELEFVPQ